MSQVSADHSGRPVGAHDHGHGDDDHHHHHDSHVAHHFDSPSQQFSSGKLGMWLFLATEVLFFGGLFVFYSVWRANHPEAFDFGSQKLKWELGAVNTVVLILSSLTMAWGVTAAQLGRLKLLKTLLILTISGGAIFMVIKYFEYHEKLSHGFAPGNSYTGNILNYATPPEAVMPDGRIVEIVPLWGAEDMPVWREGGVASDAQRLFESAGMTTIDQSVVEPPPHGPLGLAAERRYVSRAVVEPSHVKMYFSIYFCLTGLHGVHVLVGMGLIFWIYLRARKGEFGPKYFTPVDLVGLYWHLVDLIWIFLFPLLYLI